ncbi:MAG: gamma-glutamylcyclotransferase family protein [Pseudomonadota bacterium]
MTLPPVSPGDAFAFYGLLKQGAAGMPENIDLEATGAFEGPIRLLGTLHDLGGFPGMVQGETLCHAVIWRISDVSIVPALDDFEDVLPDDPAASLYRRERWPLLDDTATPTGETAHIYVFNQSTAQYPVISDGNWPLDRGRTRK